MSSELISHQFYKYWVQTPEPVQAAIFQELTDIKTFLQTDSTCDTFKFSIDDLDAHLDTLYRADDLQKMHKKEQVVVPTTPSTQQPLVAKKQPEMPETAVYYSAKDTNNTDAKDTNNTDKISANNTPFHQERKTTEPPTTPDIGDGDGFQHTIKLSAHNSTLNPADEKLISELGAHIDDYLSEQMAQLSEDLKSWLRAEISHQLGKQ